MSVVSYISVSNIRLVYMLQLHVYSYTLPALHSFMTCRTHRKHALSRHLYIHKL